MWHIKLNQMWMYVQDNMLLLYFYMVFNIKPDIVDVFSRIQTNTFAYQQIICILLMLIEIYVCCVKYYFYWFMFLSFY